MKGVSCEFWIGSIGIIVFENDYMWLTQKDGEGMQVNSEDIEELLQVWYEENF